MRCGGGWCQVNRCMSRRIECGAPISWLAKCCRLGDRGCWGDGSLRPVEARNVIGRYEGGEVWYKTAKKTKYEYERSVSEDESISQGIPYRYEYPLVLEGNVKVYLDFTILKMPEREEVYLEHFGMMDVEEIIL